MTDRRVSAGKVEDDLSQEPQEVSLVEHRVQASMPRLAFHRDHYSQVI